MKEMKKAKPPQFGNQMSQEQMLAKMQQRAPKKEQPKVKKIDYKDKETVVAEETIVEVDETRDPATIVLIGHVDAGKSTISGNLMYQLGVVD